MLAEAANRERGAVERERRNDRVDTRAVGQARIDHRRRFIDAPADSRDYSVDDQHQMLVVLERNVGGVQLAKLFDVNLVVAVDEDVGDGVVAKERLERTEAEQLVFEFLDQASSVDIGKQAAFFVENVVNCGGDLDGDHRGLERFEFRDVDGFEELVVDLDLEASRAIGDSIFAAANGRADQRAATVSGVSGPGAGGG